MQQATTNGDHTDGGAGGGGAEVTPTHRRVRFREDEALVAHFDDTNLWAHGKGEWPHVPMVTW